MLGPPMSICSISASNGTSGLGGGLDERIQVDDDDVDEADAVALGGVQVVAAVAAGEDAAVNQRMQRLDAPVHHLGEAGDVGDVGHRQPGLGQRAGGAAGGDQFQAAPAQPVGQVDQAGFVGDTQKGSGHVTIRNPTFCSVTSASPAIQG